jgi:hypothetical protein
MIECVARGQAKQARDAERKEAAFQNINRPPPPNPHRQPDVFDIAKANYYARQEYIAAVIKQCDDEERALEQQLARRRRALAIKQRALQVLKDTEHLVPKGRRR